MNPTSAETGYGGICVDDGTGIGDGSPESSESFELGVKADLFDDRFMLTAAAFQITKGDVFESAGDGYSAGGSLNTGENRVRGLEFGLVGNITPKLLAQAALTVMESEVTESNDPDKIGRRLSNFANTQFSGQVRYQATDALAFGETATYKGALYMSQPDDAASFDDTLEIYTYRVPDYWTFDALSASTNHNFVRVNVTNVTDEDYISPATVRVTSSTRATSGGRRSRSQSSDRAGRGLCRAPYLKTTRPRCHADHHRKPARADEVARSAKAWLMRNGGTVQGPPARAPLR